MCSFRRRFGKVARHHRRYVLWPETLSITKGENMVFKPEATVFASPNKPARPTRQNAEKLACWDLFVIFLKAGVVFLLTLALTQKLRWNSLASLLVATSAGMLIMPSGSI